MKNKKSIYILLPVVLLVWGVVIFQFFSFTTPDVVLDNTVLELNIKPFKLKERSTFSVDVNYRDPFLGKVYAVNEASKVKKDVVKVKKKPKPEETIVWPTILYKGLISDVKGKNKTFMIVISGKNHFMKVGETENEIFLKDGDKESIYVKYKGNLNIIMLAE
jgi:hypothetical protein